METFDQTEFISLLKKAIGGRTAKQFAEEAGSSKYLISRRLTGNFTSAPRKTTLKAYAQASEERVTYEEFLKACGYPVETARQDLPDPEIMKQPDDQEVKYANFSILSRIQERHIPCSIRADYPRFSCDFELSVGEDTPILWSFKCLPASDDSDQVTATINRHYLELMYCRLDAYSKLSFVTSSKTVFQTCSQKTPVNLSANVSVILYSKENMSVLDEKQLSTSMTDPLSEEYSQLLCHNP